MAWWLSGTGGRGGKGELWAITFSCVPRIIPGDLLSRVVPIANNMVLCTLNFAKRVNTLSVLNMHAHTQRHKETFRGDEYVCYLGGTDSVSTMILSLRRTQILGVCPESIACIKHVICKHVFLMKKRNPTQGWYLLSDKWPVARVHASGIHKRKQSLWTGWSMNIS